MRIHRSFWVRLILLASAYVFILPSSFAEKVSEKQRIVSAGGSITEILHALNLSDQLVGIDTSSLYPSEIQDLPKVGYFRSLGAEGLLSLKPDLLVVARGAGPDNVLDQIQQFGVEVKVFEQSIYNLESWQTLINEIGAYFQKREAAQRLIQSSEQKLEALRASQNYSADSLNALSLMSLGQRGIVAGGKNTVPDFLLNLANVKNLAASIEGFKPYSAELLAKQKLDLIFVPAHNLEKMGGKDGICNHDAIKLATAEGCNVVVMDPLLLLGFGARIAEATEDVVEAANQQSASE